MPVITIGDETKIYGMGESFGVEIPPKKTKLSVGDILINENDSSKTLKIEKITGARKVTFSVDGTIVKNKPERVDSKGFYQTYEKQRYYLPNSEPPPPKPKPVAPPPKPLDSSLLSSEKFVDIVQPQGSIFQNIMKYTTFADPNFQMGDILYPIEKSTALSKETDDLIKVLRTGKTLLVKDMKTGEEKRKEVAQITLDGKVLNYVPYNRLKYTKYQNFTNFPSLTPMIQKPMIPKAKSSTDPSPPPTKPIPIPKPVEPMPPPTSMKKVKVTANMIKENYLKARNEMLDYMASISPDFAEFRNTTMDSDFYDRQEERSINTFLEFSPSFFREVMSSEYGSKVAQREMEAMAIEDIRVTPTDPPPDVEEDTDEDTDDGYEEDFFDE